VTRGSSVAALITALGSLRPSPETALQIAELLGLSLEDGAVDQAPPLSQRVLPSPPRSDEASEADEKDAFVTSLPLQAPLTQTTDASSSGQKQLRLESVMAVPTTPRSFRGLSGASPREASGGALEHEPLLRPLVTRAVVAASLARRVPNGPVAVAQLVETLARRKPLRRIPRENVTAVAASARVLIDCGPGMTPFSRDAEDLSTWIRAVVSRDRAELLQFWQTPRKVGPSPRRAARAAPPAPGTVVVALTDLGIARTGSRVPGLTTHWLELNAELRAHGSSLMVFVPYPETRWPAALVGQLALLPWDRRTSVVDVRAARPTARGRT
jgi:hypothetical protein